MIDLRTRLQTVLPEDDDEDTRLETLDDSITWIPNLDDEPTHQIRLLPPAPRLAHPRLLRRTG